MAAASDIFRRDDKVIITSKRRISSLDCITYIRKEFEAGKFRDGSILLILYGVHGHDDGQIGEKDKSLKISFEAIPKKIGKKHPKILEKVKIEMVDVGDHKDSTKLDEQALIDAISKIEHTILFLAFCYTDRSRLNELLRSAGLYSILILTNDTIDTTDENCVILDKKQKEAIQTVANDQPKNIVIRGSSGSGKTLLASQFVMMKHAFYMNKFGIILAEDAYTRIKVLVCTYSKEVLPLTEAIQDELFGDFRVKGFNLSFEALEDLCLGNKIDQFATAQEVLNFVMDALNYMLDYNRPDYKSDCRFDKIILLVDEFPPDDPDLSKLCIPEKIDLILSIRHERIYAPGATSDGYPLSSFGTETVVTSEDTFSVTLTKRYRCCKEILAFILSHEKHSGDLNKISGNMDIEPDMDKLPNGQMPIWIDRDGSLSNHDLLNMLKTRLESRSTMVIHGKIDYHLAKYCEDSLNWKYFPANQIHGIEAEAVILLDMDLNENNFDWLECISRAKSALYIVTTRPFIKSSWSVADQLIFTLQHQDMYCINIPNCPFFGHKIIERETYLENPEDEVLAGHKYLLNQNIFRFTNPGPDKSDLVFNFQNLWHDIFEYKTMNANAYEEKWNTTIFDKIAIQNAIKSLEGRFKTAQLIKMISEPSECSEEKKLVITEENRPQAEAEYSEARVRVLANLPEDYCSILKLTEKYDENLHEWLLNLFIRYEEFLTSDVLTEKYLEMFKISRTKPSHDELYKDPMTGLTRNLAKFLTITSNMETLMNGFSTSKNEQNIEEFNLETMINEVSSGKIEDIEAYAEQKIEEAKSQKDPILDKMYLKSTDEQLINSLAKVLNKNAKIIKPILWQACLDGNIEKIREILEKYKKNSSFLKTIVCEKGNDKYSLLHIAAAKSAHEILRLFLEFTEKFGADIDVLDFNNLTPFHYASFQGDVEIAKLLLNMGADISKPLPNGNLPIIQPVSLGHKDMVEFLVDQGVNIECFSIDKGYGLLHICVQENQIEILKYLISKNANVNKQTFKGKTPCYLAARYDRREILKILLENGCDPNIKSSKGTTALDVAQKKGLKEICDLLIKEN